MYTIIAGVLHFVKGFCKSFLKWHENDERAMPSKYQGASFFI